MELTAKDRERMRAWVEDWKRIGPILETIRRNELRRYDYRKNMELVDGLLDTAFRFGSPRNTSGLIEMQRLFARSRP